MALLPFGSAAYKLKIGNKITSGAAGEILYVDSGGNLGQTATVLNSSGQLTIAAGQGLVLQPPAGSNTTAVELNSSNFAFSNYAIANVYPAAGTNVVCLLNIVPKGNPLAHGAPFSNAQMSFFNTDFVADSTNYETMVIAAKGSSGYSFTVGAGGTGSQRNLTFAAQASALPQLTIDTLGNIVIGNGAVATNATNGFFYIETCSGTPTGTPTSYSGAAALIYDTFNHKFWAYDTGTASWRGVLLT